MKHFLLLFFVLAEFAIAEPKHHDFHFLELPATINADAGKKLSPEAIDFDLEQLTYALSSAYSGRKFLPPGEMTSLKTSLNSIDRAGTAGRFCAAIGKAIAKVSDSHLKARLNGEVCFEGQGVKPGRVGANSNAGGKTPWKVELQTRAAQSALVISITSFPSGKDPIWNGFLDRVKELRSKAALVIIDLRDNAGGDDTMGFELSHLLAGNNLKSPYSSQWTSQTPESAQLFVNSFDLQILQKTQEGIAVSPHLRELKKEYEKKRDDALAGKIAPEESASDDGRDEFDYAKSIQKPIYILIDSSCASSGESTADAFEFNKLAKTVGEPSAGYIHFGNTGVLVLKNSGIRVGMAVSFNRYFDGRFIEKKGISPKIAVPPGGDAFAAAWSDFSSRTH